MIWNNLGNNGKLSAILGSSSVKWKGKGSN